MNRRQALKLIGAGSVVTAASGTVWLLGRPYHHPHLAIELELKRLSTLDAEALVTRSAWGVARTFHHLAQSIEFSMTGYPKMKSAFFQHSVGSLAFSVFNARGQMVHGLDEQIPGEVVDTGATSNAEALLRLHSALKSFDEFGGALQPHFAYGELSKEQYARAHVMHINNHFEEITL